MRYGITNALEIFFNSPTADQITQEIKSECFFAAVYNHQISTAELIIAQNIDVNQ